jgi:4-hydroxybenzoate polyprenyltransferase
MQFLTNSSILIAFFAGAITLFYSQLLSGSLDLIRFVLNTCATFIIYNLVQIIPIYTHQETSKRREWFKRNLKVLYFLLFVAALSIIGLLRYLDFYDILNYTHLIIICLIYEGPFKFSLRKIPYFKSILISYVWTLAIVAPHYYDNYIIPSPWWILEFFLYIFALCLAFDLRDRVCDVKENIKTIVNKISFYQAKYLIYSLYLLSLVILIALIGPTSGVFIYFVIHTLILTNINENKKDKFYLWAIDGLILIKSIVLWYL